MARLAETQAHASTVRIPLPQELAQTSKLRKSLLGKVELPQVVIPQAPIRSMPSSNPLRSAVAGVTSRHKKSLSHDSLPLTANTFLVCNCNMVGPAEVYTAIARTVSHTLLPPLTATSFPSSWAQVSPGDSTFPARVPFHLPPTCAVLYDELYASEVYDSSDGRHVFIGGASPSSAPLLAPFTESSVFSSDPPPSATSGLYTAFLPGVASLTLRLPPSILDNVPVTIKFVNTHRAHTVEVYWVDYDGNLVIRRLLK